MATPRLIIIAVRNIREKRRMIRGTLAEMNDSELTDAMDEITVVPPVQIDADRNGQRWPRPVISAPDPVTGQRWARWGIWAPTVSAAAEDHLRALAQADTDIRFFKQRADEPDHLMTIARANAGLNWIDRPTT